MAGVPTEETAPAAVLEALPVAARSPFELGPVLRSHRLRGLRPDVVASILTAEEGGELAIEALALPMGEGPDGVPRLAFLLELDGAGFLSHNRAEVARVEVYVYVLAAGSRVTAHLAEVFAVDVGELGETIWQSGLKLYAGLEVPPGSYEARVLVRNDSSGAHGVRRLPVTVPESADQPVLPPLSFPGPASRDTWLSVRSPSFVDVREHAYPFLAGGEAVSPAARAVLVAGREARAILFHRGAGESVAGGTPLAIELAPDAARASGQSGAASGTVTVEARRVSAGPGALDSTAVELSFVPPELPPGLYNARLVRRGGTIGSSPWTPVAVVGAETRERDLLWSDLRWMLQRRSAAPLDLAGAARPAEREELSKRARRGRAVRRLAERYRQVLEELEPDSLDGARAALFELESEALGRGDRQGALRLREAELTVAERLGRHSAEALLPLIRLHDEVGEQYRGRRIFSLVAHARSMVEILAETYAELGGEGALTARALASQAGYRQQANLLSSSRRLFGRALEHAPENRSALLGLAASFEKYAQYNLAIEYLELLVALAPELEEARLRLAVNQTRVGWVPRARESFESMIANGTGDWVGELAVEELARLDLTAGNVAEAREILQTAVERFPDAAGIRVLLAHAYDRLGRVDRSLRLLDGIEAAPSAEPSARRRYDEWPVTLLEEDRRMLRERADAALPVMAAALAESASG